MFFAFAGELATVCHCCHKMIQYPIYIHMTIGSNLPFTKFIILGTNLYVVRALDAPHEPPGDDTSPRDLVLHTNVSPSSHVDFFAEKNGCHRLLVGGISGARGQPTDYIPKTKFVLDFICKNIPINNMLYQDSGFFWVLELVSMFRF